MFILSILFIAAKTICILSENDVRKLAVKLFLFTL